MDLDGDGVISMYEMEYFYEEQMQKMEALGIEKLPFEDCLCQVSYAVYVRWAVLFMSGEPDCLCQVSCAVYVRWAVLFMSGEPDCLCQVSCAVHVR